MKYRVLWSQLRRTLMFYQWHWDRGIRGLNELGRTASVCFQPIETMFGHDYPCLKSAYNGALLFEQTKRL